MNENLKQELDTLINQTPVVLFMKGDPDFPQCGFSMRAVEILKSLNVSFSHFDILTNEMVRQSLKEYSNWPTYPQLYVKGELIGGVDIMEDMLESNELRDIVKTV